MRVPEIRSGGDFIWAYSGGSASAFRQPVWDSAHIGIWHMNGLRDSSGAENHGIFEGGVEALADGISGSGIRFDGEDDCIRIAHNDGFNGILDSFALTIVVENDGTVSQPRLVSKTNDWNLKLNSDNPQITGGGGYAISSTNLENVPEVVSVLFDRGNVRFIVNGEVTSIGTNTYVGGETFNSNEAPLAIGCVGDSQHFSGVIDEVQLSTEARDATWVGLQQMSILRRLVIPGMPEVRDN